jgi:hypothetical protein
LGQQREHRMPYAYESLALNNMLSSILSIA